MLADVPIEEVEEVMGTKGRTATRHLKKALHHYGWKTGERLRLCHPRRVYPDTCIVKVRVIRVRKPYMDYNHWILYHNEHWYDPDATKGECVIVLPGVYRGEISYLEIWK